MAKKDKGRGKENNHSAKNHAAVSGNNNETNQAGRDIVNGDVNKFPDEGRVKTDVFTMLSEISRSIAKLLFKLGVGDRLERLATPATAIIAAVGLIVLGDMANTAFEPTGTLGMFTEGAASISYQTGDLLSGILADRPEIALIALLVLIPVWYKGEKFTSTCVNCNRPFAAMTRTVEYPSRASFDQEGNRHVPVDRERFCMYCDGDAEIADDTHSGDEGESAPQIMADGGGDDDAGACSCSCHNEN